MTRHQVAVAAATVAAAAVAGAAATVGITAGRVLAAERRQRRHEATPPGGDVLLVLGAQALPDRPSRELQARLDHAVTRWRAGAAPTIAVSGGLDGAIDETQVMADYLLGCGVPATAIRRIVPGENTRASMRSMAAGAPGSAVVAVSSPYHAHRIVAEGRRCGLQTVADCPASTPETDNPEVRRTRLFGEVVASVLYAAPEGTIPVVRHISVPVRRRLPQLAARAGAAVRGLRRRP